LISTNSRTGCWYRAEPLEVRRLEGPRGGPGAAVVPAEVALEPVAEHQGAVPQVDVGLDAGESVVERVLQRPAVEVVVGRVPVLERRHRGHRGCGRRRRCRRVRFLAVQSEEGDACQHQGADGTGDQRPAPGGPARGEVRVDDLGLRARGGGARGGDSGRAGGDPRTGGGARGGYGPRRPVVGLAGGVEQRRDVAAGHHEPVRVDGGERLAGDEPAGPGDRDDEGRVGEVARIAGEDGRDVVLVGGDAGRQAVGADHLGEVAQGAGLPSSPWWWGAGRRSVRAGPGGVGDGGVELGGQQLRGLMHPGPPRRERR
jgi:hypothetical protein